MPRFTFGQLLVSLTLIAIGAGQIAFSIGRVTLPEPDNVAIGTILFLVEMALTFSAGALLGAGIANLWKRPMLGAALGTAIWFCFIAIRWMSDPPS